jgi:hypothetical protein
VSNTLYSFKARGVLRVSLIISSYIYILKPVSFFLFVWCPYNKPASVSAFHKRAQGLAARSTRKVCFLIACLSFAGAGAVAASVTAAAAAAAGCLLLLPPPSPISCLLDLLAAFWSLLLIAALPAACRGFRN